MAPTWTPSWCALRGRGVLFKLGLPFLLLLPSTGCSPQPSWRYTAYETVIPRKLGPKAGKGSQNQVSYIISGQEVNYTIHLRKKDFVIKNFPVFASDSRGKIVVELPHVPTDCYYHGYVEGILDSMVTLNTCSGLRGLLQIGNSSYSIEPLAASTTAEHLLSQREEVVPETVMYKMPKRGGQFPASGKATRQFQAQRQTRYLELLVVVDKAGFDAFGKSITNVTLEVIEIINLVDGLFYSFHLRVLITALEVWVEKNPISVTENITEVLNNFNLWRKQKSSAYATHDVGCLFASTGFGDGRRARPIWGKANFASACDQERASAVVSFAKRPYMDTALRVARVLGHVLGVRQNDRYCRCGNTSKCIMSPDGTENYQFSNCSKKHYLDFIASGQGFCLNNPPEMVRTLELEFCGNGVLEDGEECDCGSEIQCKLDHCCDDTCHKKAGAICTSGGCCKNCKPLPEGAICRETAGPCDLPEYCNGTSDLCPADVTKQDGTPCADDGYCYSGQCQSRTLQCKSIFGKEAKPAPLSCSLEVNTKGDRFGHCWGDGLASFEKCKLENVMCGRLQCTNVRHLPQVHEFTTIIQTPMGNTWCWGVEYYFDGYTSDIGGIEDGMQCGEKMMCINRTCIPMEEYLASPCSSEKTCRGRGVCNNRGNCHCDSGWAPPFCHSFGFGGSIDSGPAPVTEMELFWIIVGITIVTISVLVLLTIFLDSVRKLRVTQALRKYLRSFCSREGAPKEDAENQVKEVNSKPAGT
ncbi:disintegrin and metalloproteinase domain-containing protein 9-like [Apus apus]|uniref:disintegrin and metalloproteinase domain-containing protein 9-like n=1 Tax=Apus apus TaxID=8895 RepID=UPI0021F8EC83|nr:disintegrin and metalloproteinase domain-containing protein 9-like [Apus apus]